jgi:hypothetical protein
MKLGRGIENQVTDIGVETFEASRVTTVWWNRHRSTREPRFFCGWYWYTKKDTTTINGPFKTRSAAIRDAYVRGVMRANQMIDGETLAASPRKLVSVRK